VQAKNIIVALLNRDPTKRLGSKNDVDDIKAQAFFKELGWEKLLRKEIDPPYKPRVKGNDDTTNFDETFTKEPVVDSVVQGSKLSEMSQDGDSFSGFTFQQKDGVIYKT